MNLVWTRWFLVFVIGAVIVGCSGQPAAAPEQSKPAPQSSTTGKALSEDELGVKFYPGARVVTSGETDQALSANLETPDKAEQAIAFYEKELGAKAESNNGLSTIDAKKGDTRYVVVVTASGGVTSISIMGQKPASK